MHVLYIWCLFKCINTYSAPMYVDALANIDYNLLKLLEEKMSLIKDIQVGCN